MAMSKKWIKGAIKRKGSLRRWAEKKDAIRGGRINLTKARRIALREREPARRERLEQIALAKRLRRMRR
jgi:hypothetical protein